MSLTITPPVGPGDWIPSGNEIIYTITTTTNWNRDLYFLIDVIVNGSTVLTLRKSPLHGQQSVKINLRDIVDVYLENNPYLYNNIIFFETTTRKTVADLRVSVEEILFERSQVAPTTFPVYVWKATEQFIDHKGTSNVSRFAWTFTAASTLSEDRYQGRPMGYHKTVGVNVPFLEFRPDGWYLQDVAKKKAYKTNRNVDRDVHIFSNYTSGPIYILSLGFDADGKLIHKSFARPGTLPALGVDNHLIRWDARFDGFLRYCKYVVYILSSSFHAQFDYTEDFISQPLIFDMYDSEESFAVWYKSYEGGWNIIQCNNRAAERTSVDTTTRANALPNLWASDSRMISPVYVKAHSTWVLNTDWIDQYENEDVKDMLQSPCLFIQHYKKGKKTYIPVTLSNASFTTKEVNSKNLFNYKIEFEESFYKNTVRP